MNTNELITQWWVNQLFEKSNNFNNGDNSQEGGMTFMLAVIAKGAAQDKTPNHSIQAFKLNMMEFLNSGDERSSELYVDYSPNYELSLILEKSGVSPMLCPWKSGTYIKDGKPYAKSGYGNGYHEITKESLNLD